MLKNEFLNNHGSEITSIYFQREKLEKPKVLVSISGIKVKLKLKEYSKKDENLDVLVDIKNVGQNDIFKDHFNILLRNLFQQEEEQ